MEWNLNLIYPSYADFLEELNSIETNILALEGLKGKLNTLEGFKTYDKENRELSEKISRSFCYAYMKYDLNQKDTKAAVDYQKVNQVYHDFNIRTSFITPELLAAGKETITRFLKEEPGLQVYEYTIDRLFRNQSYVLDEKSERLLANYNEALDGYNRLYDKLAVTDNASTTVTISTGETLSLNESNFQYYLGILENQEDRRIVFETIFKFYEAHKNTFAGIYDGIMQSELAEVKSRGFGSILESHLYGNAIPTEVFESLIQTAREHTEPLKRYCALRKKFFGLKTYHTYDRFLDFAKSDKEYTYEASKAMVLDACRSLGEDYYQHACRALESGRVSVYTTDGKRTGAYSTSLYKEGSFILLNHNDNLDSAFTIAHEAGHSIHSLYANETQDMLNANYAIFVAEIASTFNEQLFLDYIMQHSTSKEEKIVVLQRAIDNIVSTFYRQTLFANYEKLAHELVEQRIPVTAEELEKIMEELYLTYYGIDLKEEPYKNNVWAYIPHFFHTPFYVYQYATSFAASMAIYENVKKNPESLKDYIKMLSMGGSAYPIEIVKTSGIDLTKPDAFLSVVERLDELTSELEKLLK